MPVLAYLFLVGFMTLQPGAELLNQGGGRCFFLRKALILIFVFVALLVADFGIIGNNNGDGGTSPPGFVECTKPTRSTYVPHLPFAFVRFSSEQRWPPGRRLVAELYDSNGVEVTSRPLDFWDSSVSPGLGGYTQGNQFYGFAIDKYQIGSDRVKARLEDRDCSGLQLVVHDSGSAYPRLVADLSFASVDWNDAVDPSRGQYVLIDMRGQPVEYEHGAQSDRGDVVYRRESADTSLNVDSSFSGGRGYGVHSQGKGGSRSSSSSGSSIRGGAALSGGRQWAGAKWRGYRR